MAIIAPFRGIRYNTARIDDLSTVIAPPYDVIDERGQDAYYNRSPYNIIRLEYGRERNENTPCGDRYTCARRTFERWQDEEILVTEKRPLFYLYQQSFTYRNTRYHRKGIIAALKVEPYRTRAVLPHEQTLAEPKADRLSLFRSCKANFSPIFTLFPDPQKTVERICAPLLDQPPLFEFRDQLGEEHRLWALGDLAQQEALAGFISSRSLIIADGHHRYETSLHFSQEAAAGGSNRPGFSYALTVMVSMHSPHLLILPTHRLLNSLPPDRIKDLPGIAAANFNIQPRGNPRNLGGDFIAREIEQYDLNVPNLAMILEEQVYLLTLKPQLCTGDCLDVDLLQELIINPLLKDIPEINREQVISYTIENQEVVDKIANGHCQAGFILNPTPMEALVSKAQRGEMMPQKSTYFFPKLPSGLVIYSLEKSL